MSTPVTLSAVGLKLYSAVHAEQLDEIEQISLERAPAEACGVVIWGSFPSPSHSSHSSLSPSPFPFPPEPQSLAQSSQPVVSELKNRWDQQHIALQDDFTDHTSWDAYAMTGADVTQAISHAFLDAKLASQTLARHSLANLDHLMVDDWLDSFLVWHSHPRGSIGPSEGDKRTAIAGIRYGVMALALPLDQQHLKWTEYPAKPNTSLTP